MEVAALQFVKHQTQQQNNNYNHITTVLDVLQDADCLFIVMPFYDYYSLADVLNVFKTKYIPADRAIPETFAKAFFLNIIKVHERE